MKTDVILATIDVYNTSSDSLLPTPTKSHYLFNLRDVARVCLGLTMLPAAALPPGRAGATKFVRLWVHETLRVFYDRLTDDGDRLWLLNYVKDVTAARLGTDFDDAFRHVLPTAHAQAGLEDLRSVFFTDFMDEAAEEPHLRKYDEAQVWLPAWRDAPCAGRVALSTLDSITQRPAGNTKRARRNVNDHCPSLP